MPKHPTIRSWTPDQIAKLEHMIASGSSAVRAAAALKRPIASVRAKARELGKNFPKVKEFRRRVYTEPRPTNEPPPY
jgi:hypothetical protein